MKIYVIIPENTGFFDIFTTINQIAEEYGYSTVRSYELSGGEKVTKEIHNRMQEADLIIADVSNRSSSVMYELGFANSLGKPIYYISQLDKTNTIDLANFNIHFYDRERLSQTLSRPLKNLFSRDNLEDYLPQYVKEVEEKIKNRQTVFVSYSHQDTEYLDRLKVHLKPFEREGIIDLWEDRKIKLGEKWKEKIEQALDKSAIAILMISADFLASDFILDNELPPLLSEAESNGKTILPVILKPCRFKSYERLSQFQAANDPENPLSGMNENQKEKIYVKIANHIAASTSSNQQ